jgi:Flp pilus assembly protein TadD
MATPEQLLQQAREYHQQGQMQTALDLYRSAVRAAPRSVDAQTGLGVALAQVGRDAEAVEHLERAIKLDPTNPESLCNLGMAHRSQGRLAEALTCYERAVWMSKRHPRAVAGAAEVYALQGKYGKAHALLLPYVSSEQDQPAIALTYARCCRALDKPADAAQVLARHLSGQRGQLQPLTRVFMLLELAQIGEALGHPDRAFAAATDANRLLGRRFNAERYNSAIDATIEAWSAEAHKALPVSTNESDLPVFVVGMPRAGEALVEQIIASHPEAAPAGETAVSRHLVTQLEGVPSQEIMPFSRTQPMTFQAVNDGARFTLGTLSMIARRDGYEKPSRIVDRCSHNYLYLGMLDRMLPKARVIHVRRNPLDTALSCYMNHFDIPYHFKIHLADFAHAYMAYQRLMDHWKGVVGMPILEVDYEDIVSDLEGQARRIIDFLGLEWNDACLRFWETPRRMIPFANMGILKPIYDSSVGKHSRYEQFVAPLRSALGMPPAETAPSAES